MHAQCPNCSARYRLQERSLRPGARMRFSCRRCGADIVIFGPGAGEQADDDAPPPVPMESDHGSPAPTAAYSNVAEVPPPVPRRTPLPFPTQAHVEPEPEGRNWLPLGIAAAIIVGVVGGLMLAKSLVSTEEPPEEPPAVAAARKEPKKEAPAAKPKDDEQDAGAASPADTASATATDTATAPVTPTATATDTGAATATDAGTAPDIGTAADTGTVTDAGAANAASAAAVAPPPPPPTPAKKRTKRASSGSRSAAGRRPKGANWQKKGQKLINACARYYRRLTDLKKKVKMAKVFGDKDSSDEEAELRSFKSGEGASMIRDARSAARDYLSELESSRSDEDQAWFRRKFKAYCEDPGPYF